MFERCARGVAVPAIYLEFSGDQAAPRGDADRMDAALAATDKTRAVVPGQHFGQPLRAGEPTGYQAAAALLEPWLAERFELAPPY